MLLLRIVSLLAIVYISFGVGRKILNWLKVECNSWLENFVFSQVMGFGILSYLTFFLGISHLLYRYVFHGLLLILFILLLVSEFGKLRELLRRRGKKTVLSRIARTDLIILILLLVQMSINFIGAAAPQVEANDALVYHLNIPKLYIDNHRIIPIDNLLYSNFPLVVEMLYILAMLLIDDMLPALIHFWFGVLIVLSIYSFCKEHFSVKIALLASALFYIIPSVSLLSSWAYIDLGLVFFELVALYSLFNWLRGGKGWLIVSAIVTGFSLGTKYTGAFSLVLLVTGIFYKVYFLDRQSLRKAARAAILFVSISVAIALPWYLKNLIFIGNPVFPFLYNIFRTPESDFARYVYMTWMSYGTGRSPGSLILLPWNLTFKETYEGFIGPLFLGFGPALFFLRGVDRKIKYLICYSFLFFVLWAGTSQLIRHLLPGLAVVSIVVSYAVNRMTVQGNGLFKRMISLIIIFTFLFNIAIYGYRNFDKFGVVLGQEPVDVYLARRLHKYYRLPPGMLHYINFYLPPSAKIFHFATGIGYYLNQADYTPASFQGYLLKQAKDSSETVRRLREFQVTHLLILEGQEVAYQNIFGRDFRKKYLEMLYSENGARLYQIIE